MINEEMIGTDSLNYYQISQKVSDKEMESDVVHAFFHGVIVPHASSSDSLSKHSQGLAPHTQATAQ